MNEKNPVKKTEKTTRKALCIILAINIACVGIIILLHSSPFSTKPVSGTVVILNEDGNAIPLQPVRATYFSHYAMEFFWSDRKRKSSVNVNPSGTFSVKKPNFNGTMFFETDDRKYATVVDICWDEPATGLDVMLRPRYSATGRLLNAEGKPLANQEVSLVLQRSTDDRKWLLDWSRSGVTMVGLVETFHKDRTTTDAEGYFTVDRLIPGVGYLLYTHNNRSVQFGMPLEIPILQPGQYQEPYDLGDIVIGRR